MSSATASAAAISPVDDDLAVIVFGVDEGGKPHASAFGTADAELAEKAARLMGFRSMGVTVGERQLVAASLPKGRIFASGRAFTPFVRKGVFDRLVALAGPPEEAAEATRLGDGDAGCEAAENTDGADAVGAGAGSADEATGIAGNEREEASEPQTGGDDEAEPLVGKVRKGKPAEAAAPHLPETFAGITRGSVVLAPELDHGSWWVAIVQRPWGKASWVLRWRDFAEEQPFTRRTRDLALLNPAYPLEG